MKPIPNKAKIIAYYQDKLEASGFSAEGMDWKNEETQHLRFEMLNRHIDFSDGPSILDIGCGAGAYYHYSKSKEARLQYTGLDIVSEMIEHLNETIPGRDHHLGDVQSYAIPHDYVIASGTFNASIGSSPEDWLEYLESSILQMYRLAKRAVVFNLMSPYVDYTYDRLYYPDLNALTAFMVKHCGRDFIIDHDYALYEMTIKISK